MERSQLAIIIPAFNEDRTIGGVVGALLEYGVPIVVSDGSTDRTVEIATQAGAIVVGHTTNSGYDSALNAGFTRATGIGARFALTFDADGQHDPASVGAFIKLLDDGIQVVLGVRQTRARFSENMFAFYTRAAYGVHDPLCGLKGYNMAAYDRLGHFDSYGSVGTELMLFCIRAGLPFAEVPTRVSRRNGSARLGDWFRANLRIIRALAFALIYRPRAARG